MQVCAVQGKSNSFPISSEQPNIYFALKRFSIEAIHTRLRSLKKFHRRKLEKLYKKEEKYKKALYFELVAWQRYIFRR